MTKSTKVSDNKLLLLFLLQLALFICLKIKKNVKMMKKPMSISSPSSLFAIITYDAMSYLTLQVGANLTTFSSSFFASSRLLPR